MKAPLVLGRANWVFIIFQLGVIALITYLYSLAKLWQPFILAALTYSVTAFILRSIFSLHFKAARYLMRQQQYAEAIPYIELALKYYSTKKWIDKYRFITMLSASGTSYYGMCLYNIGFCYSQIGDGGKAKEYYQLTLIEDPRNNLAHISLNMLNSMESNTEI